MGDVVNLFKNVNEKKSAIINHTDGRFSSIFLEFPEHIGSKFAIFVEEGDLSKVDVNSLLFQLNAVIMEECQDFKTVSELAYGLVSFMEDMNVDMLDLIYKEDRTFIEPVIRLIDYLIPLYIDRLYPTTSVLN